MYQFRGNRQKMLQLRAFHINERRDYGSTPSAFGNTANASDRVRETVLVGTYVFNETWSASAGHISVKTNSDAVRYLNGSGDSKIKYYEVAYVPFGKQGSWGAPWANLRLLAAWIKFDKFNGATTDLFGARFFGGPATAAGDLNSFQLSANVAF
ncbi:MAG: hypothetical protein ABI433_13205 [Burkholderiaceae bacterium]